LKGFREFKSYAEVSSNKTEQRVTSLASAADAVIKTDRCVGQDVVIRAAAHLRLFGRENLRLVDVLIGGEYGSEGKGHISAYLAPEYDLLVRVGGPNAGHKTFTQDGRALRRYRRRWKVERLFAWPHNYRRIVVRWEHRPENFLAMVHLASAVILLRHL